MAQGRPECRLHLTGILIVVFTCPGSFMSSSHIAHLGNVVFTHVVFSYLGFFTGSRTWKHTALRALEPMATMPSWHDGTTRTSSYRIAKDSLTSYKVTKLQSHLVITSKYQIWV